MIKNGNEYFGIAGVMGGLDSEILNDTTSVFLESATFNAGSIRRCAVNLGLRTEASARYEKSLDPNMAELAVKRFVYLLRKVNLDMIITSNLTDVYPNPLYEETIILDKKALSIYMGKTLDDMVVKNILEKLDFKVTVQDDLYQVVVPTNRCTKDIKIKQDVIEEIARIYGLEEFSPKPLKLDLTPIEHENIFGLEYDVKRLLATKFDMNEVNSYLWYDTNMLHNLGIEKDNVKLIGKDVNNILRDDLALSLMNMAQLNFKNYNNVKIFEIGTVIQNNQNKRVLSLVFGDDEKKLESIYNEAKGIVKYLFKMLKNKEIVIKNNVNEKSYYDDTLGKVIYLDEKRIGEINVLSKVMANKLAKKKCVVTVDIDFDIYVTIDKENILNDMIVINNTNGKGFKLVSKHDQNLWLEVSTKSDIIDKINLDKEAGLSDMIINTNASSNGTAIINVLGSASG